MSHLTMPFRRACFVVVVLALAAVMIGTPAHAQQAMGSGTHDQMAKPMMGMGRGAINTDAAGLAVQGYDVVAYQTAMQATRGVAQFTATHEGATYRFASAENRDRFLAEPARYVPAYGGYCAMGVAVNRKFDIDPMAFTIVDGRLYLNKDLGTRRAWMRDIPGNNAKADTNWPNVMRIAGF